MKVQKKEEDVLSDLYKIFETDIFIEDIENLNQSIREKIKSKLKNHVYPMLRIQPYYGKNIKKLINYEPPTWRYRIGNFRIFYTIDDSEKLISMLTVSDRKDAY